MKDDLEFVRVDPACNSRNCGPIDENDPYVVELRQSIREKGVEVAIVARQDPTRENGWLLVDGFNRMAAVLPLVRDEGLDIRVKVDYRGKMSDEAAYVLSFALNLNRKSLSPESEGQACARMHGWGWSDSQIGKDLGKSTGWVAGRRALAGAPMEVRQAVAAGTLPVDVGAKLAAAPAAKVRRVLDKSKTGQRGAARRELTGVKLLSRAGIQAELDRRGQPKTCCDIAVNAMLLRLLEGSPKEK
jgi:ParB-like chromosome segregation protein Spo0J